MIPTKYIGPSCYANVGQTFGMTLQDVIDYGYDIGLTDYPIWDETMREWLNARIVDHFLLREIRAETPALFVLWLNRIMREQMPMINPMFESVWGVRYTRESAGYWETRTIERESSGSTTDTSAGTDSSTDQTTTSGDGSTSSESYTSTNPKQTMVGKDATTYYDAGTKTAGTSETSTESESSFSGSTSSSSSGTSTGEESVVETRNGYNGTVADWLASWMTAASPLMRVFEVLEPCFCQLVTDHFNVW